MATSNQVTVKTKIGNRNTAATTLPVSKVSQDALVDYCKKVPLTFLNGNYNLREQLLQRDRSYLREKDFNEIRQRMARLSANVGQPNKIIQNITIPVVMPQTETAVSYLSDIFLTGYPIFPILANKGIMDGAALQMETLVGEHSVKFAWVSNLLKCVRDGLKYNLMAVEVGWEEKRVWSIGTDPNSTGAKAAEATETYYQGNRIRRLNPYNLIMDTRIETPAEMHMRGEFAGYTELINKIELKMLIADLGATKTMNAKDAFESGTAVYTMSNGTDSFYIPELNPTALLRQGDGPGVLGTNWGSWAGLDKRDDAIQYHDLYEKTVLYVRIIPADFALAVAARNTPQIWKLILINRKIIIFAERQTNAHNYLGIIVGQPISDGLGWQSKSYAENVAPMQDAATALYTSGMESQRRKVYDRILYDPSKIDKRDIDNTSAVARIPVKQVAYGQNLAEAVHVFPYVDNGVAEVLAMAKDIAQMADKVNGSNPAQQGQFQKGNRSRKEFETIMGSANGRMQVMAIGLEYEFFQPIKEIIKLNILQFQPPTTLYNRNTKQDVDIDPVAIRDSALEFKVSDGLLPADKLINTEVLGSILQMSASNPAIAAEYDIVGMLMHTIQIQGGGWVQDFKRTPEEQTQFLQNSQAAQGQTNANGQPLPVGPAATPPQQNPA